MTQSSDKVSCPDCGGMYLPRGLASHRRQKHGEAPASAAPPKPAGESEGGALTRVLATLERIEARLERIEAGAGRIAPDNLLQLRLDEVLAEIRAVQAERVATEGEWEDERRRACDLELGRLRKVQAKVLYELDELPIY